MSVIVIPPPLTPPPDFQAVLDGTGDASVLDSLLGSLTNKMLDSIRLDVIDAFEDALDSGPLCKDERAVRLLILLAEHRGRRETAARYLVKLAGAPPQKWVVERLLDYAEFWADPEIEDEVFAAHLATLNDPLERAQFMAHVGACYACTDFDADCEKWMERAAASYANPDRADKLRAYLEATPLRYGAQFVR